MPGGEVKKDGNSGKPGALPRFNLSRKTWIILVGGIATCAILFGLYNKFFENFSPIAMFRTWNASYKICIKMYETHGVIVNTLIAIDENNTFRTIAPYLPRVPDPGDWLNGNISIV